MKWLLNSNNSERRVFSIILNFNFLKDEEQTEVQMATPRQEIKNLGSELQEHRVNAVEGHSQTLDANQKEDEMQHDFATIVLQVDTPKLVP